MLKPDNLVMPLPGITSFEELRSHLREVTVAGDSPLLSLDTLTLVSPIDPPRNILCVGWNYLKHFDESLGKREGQDVPLPDRPTLFTKLPTTVAGPYDALPLQQSYTDKLDWEVELAVIIGTGGRDISEHDALSHVFGYTVANDISARDLQRAHGAQWFKGKSLDCTCPMGPVLVTADEITNPQDLAIACYLNGEVVQSGHTSRQIFSVARVIAEISAGLTLLPGDVILTGTPEGIGAARTPPVFIRDGDTIECEVQGIGRLRNTFKAQLRDAQPGRHQG
ncbi:fumarylacetoacetate hydrolase family protein [Acidovorax sp. SRB_14]|uniref:fumarylacetoacetate hydrolase family protein n=1 Tax=Acidovorax sp. SRB_14 TaxID=1962699 RepID=UPI00352C8258